MDEESLKRLCTRLDDLVKAGNVEAVRTELQSVSWTDGPAKDFCENDCENYLTKWSTWAAGHGVELLRVLHHFGLFSPGFAEDIDRTDPRTALLRALSERSMVTIKWVLEHTPSSHYSLDYSHQETPLQQACFLKNLELVQTLLDHGAGPNVPSEDEYSPWCSAMAAAVANKWEPGVRLLKKHGAKLDAERDLIIMFNDRHAFTGDVLDVVLKQVGIGEFVNFLDYALSASCPVQNFEWKRYDAEDVWPGLFKTVQDVLARFPDATLKLRASVHDLVFEATEQDDVNFLQYAREAGLVTPDLRDESGRTPLIVAVRRNGGAVEELLKCEACVDLQDDEGRTALHWVYIVKDPDQTQFVLDFFYHNHSRVYSSTIKDMYGKEPTDYR